MFGGIGVFSSGQGVGVSEHYIAVCRSLDLRVAHGGWIVVALNSFWPNQDNNSQSPLRLGRKKVNGVLISYLSTSVFLHWHHCIGHWQDVEVMDGCCAGWSVRTCIYNCLLMYIIIIWNLQIDRYHIPITLCYVLVGILNLVHCSFLSLLRFWAVYKMILQMTVCWCNWYISYSSRYKRHLGLVLFSPIIMIAGFPNFITNLTFIKNFAI